MDAGRCRGGSATDSRYADAAGLRGGADRHGGAVVGVLGTFLTAAGSGVLLHLGFGLAWYLALLVGTAVSPTDPAVVFSVLGRQEIAGRSGTILEGESGANDPVGIALMAGLLAAGGLSGAALGGIATTARKVTDWSAVFAELHMFEQVWWRPLAGQQLVLFTT